MSTRDEYIEKLQAKLHEWNEEIDKLAALAGETAGNIKNDYYEQIESLREKQMAARKKIEDLHLSGESAWEDMKSGIEMALTAMGEAIDSAKSRFK